MWDDLEEEEFNETEFVDLFARQVAKPKKKEKKEDKPAKITVSIILLVQTYIQSYFIFAYFNSN